MDRDGVLIENVHTYVRQWSDVEIFDQAVEALKRLDSVDFLRIVVTNQSGIGRGILDEGHVRGIQSNIVEEFANRGARLDATYICPHAPDADCDCRKPKPGMLVQASLEHHIDLSRSYLVGDAVSDLEAAKAAGVKGILVLTGRGTSQSALLPEGYDGPVVKDLAAAVDLILSEI